MITEVYDLLCRLGVSPTYKGFFQTAYAVLLAVENMERLLLVTKWIYPELAKQYNTTPECIERNIRTVAAIAWQNNPELLNEMRRCQLTDRSTAAQFIAILASSFPHSLTDTRREGGRNGQS